MKKKAFTLIELLVVITIIALLVSILMPALSKAKEQAKIALCSSNLKQQSLAAIMYSNANDGRVPTFNATAGNWLWDLTYQHTYLFNKYAGIKNNEVYVCPSNMEKQANDRRWWQYSTYGAKRAGLPDPGPSPLDPEDGMSSAEKTNRYRSMPYLYFFFKQALVREELGGKYLGGLDLGRQAGDTVPSGENITWVSNMDKMKMPGERPLIIDTVISDNPVFANASFFDFTRDTNWYKDNSNHKSRSKNSKGLIPSGGNHCYVDGHVVWVNFNDYHPIKAPQYRVEARFNGFDYFYFYWKYHNNHK